ncbi:MAG: hypothetical protein JW881_13940 [Spirochaetales bacterium]|nr:hypothetical protein [Spirochaetales bacterium]
MTIKAFIITVLVLIVSLNASGDIPVKQEDVIYTVTAFNGLHFSRTFCRSDDSTIYLLHDVDNFLLPRKAFIYFWPLSGKWMAEPLDVRKPEKISAFDGTLVIERDGATVERLQSELYIIYNVSGKYSNDWKVFVGKAAETEADRLKRELSEYEKRYEAYKIKFDIYTKAKEKLVEKMKVYNDAGKDTGTLIGQYKALEEPVMPVNPTPQELSMGKQFHVVLPEGTYRTRLENRDGLTLQGSEKTLLVFGERRRKNVGYRIVPGDKWTKPIKSYSPFHVLYVDATTDIYLVPFLENEYNDLYYNKLLQNDSRGNVSMYRWEEVKELPDSLLEISSRNVSISTEQEKYYVEPLKGGASLGYKIVPYDPEGEHKDRNYEFSGFRVPIGRNETAVRIRLQDVNGNYYPSGGREIRIVGPASPVFILLFPALLPLLAMIIVIGYRRTHYGVKARQ